MHTNVHTLTHTHTHRCRKAAQIDLSKPLLSPKKAASFSLIHTAAAVAVVVAVADDDGDDDDAFGVAKSQ